MTARVELSAVEKRFASLEVLRPSTFGAGPGEVVTLLGPSGCGKTTLLRIIAGLEAPSAGEVTVDGHSPGRARAAKGIGFVPQAPAMLPWRTVGQNARLLLDVNRRATRAGHPDVDQLLDDVGLSAFTDRHPYELSGGMQQRVGLVRAFALGGSLLLMDEPFAALDEITRAEMRHLLARMCEQFGSTVVFVTHSLAEAVFVSDRVVAFSRRPGRVIDVVDIDLPRPRVADVEDSEAFFALERRLRHVLREGAAA